MGFTVHDKWQLHGTHFQFLYNLYNAFACAAFECAHSNAIKWKCQTAPPAQLTSSTKEGTKCSDTWCLHK